MLIDTHAHLEFENFKADQKRTIDRALAAGVETIINVGTTTGASAKAIQLAQKYPFIYATVGTHPIDLAEKEPDIAQMRQLAHSDKVVAIGECGLDFYHQDKGHLADAQKQLFSSQIALAHELDLPLIIHCRNAWGEMWPVLENKSFFQTLPQGVFHCFTGCEQEAKKALEMGFLISFSCIITYPKNQYLRDIIKILPLDKILVETDSPFLPPQSHRGQRNEPANVVEVAQVIAQVKNITFDQVANQTTKNAKQLFRL